MTRLSIGYCHIDEEDYVKNLSEREHRDLFYNETSIDKIIKSNCISLQLYKLSNGQILCALCNSDNIPIKCIISNDIVSGFQTLNGFLQDYEIDYGDDYTFIDKQNVPDKAFQNSLKPNFK